MTAAATIPATIASDEKRRRYAEMIVRDALSLEAGEIVFVSASIAHRELIVEIAGLAHEMGIDVDVAYNDELLRRARLEHAPEELLGLDSAWDRARRRAMTGSRTALLVVGGDEFPQALRDVPPERVALQRDRQAKHLRSFTKAIIDHRIRWSIVNWPTAAWAKLVYPDLGEHDGQVRLFDDLMEFCRLGEADAPDAMTRHFDRLEAIATELGDRPLARLELRGPGTSLNAAIAPNSRWLTARAVTPNGQATIVNVPSEEVFTSPDTAACEGTFRCTYPLSFGGVVFDGIAGEIRGGRLQNLKTDDTSTHEVLARALSIDRDAGRLGEVALVDSSSRIGLEHRTYFNTGLDENAACHIAFGAGFPQTRKPDGTRGRRGVNQSAMHLDVMIGSGELEVTAIERSGARVPLIAGGAWQVG